jgi:hypothetical protein
MMQLMFHLLGPGLEKARIPLLFLIFWELKFIEK